MTLADFSSSIFGGWGSGFGAEEGKDFEALHSLSGEKPELWGFFFGADEGEITWGEKQPGSIAPQSRREPSRQSRFDLEGK